MLDEHSIDQLRDMICDRFTAAELIEILDMPVCDVFDKFRDECMDINWSEHL